jgi:hypothetical protein
MRMEESGVAAVAVLAIVLVSAGAAVATPVVVDTIDVDPDSPFYGLERLGEQIKMVSNEAQMMERWTEYERMVDRGKALEYRAIMQEFVDKLQAIEVDNSEAKRALVEWMQEKMPGIGMVRARIAEELCERLREKLQPGSDEYKGLENELRALQRARERISAGQGDETEVRAMVELRLEAVRKIAERVRERTGENIEKWLEIADALKNAEVTVDVKVTVVVHPLPPLPGRENLENLTENLEATIAELQAMLQGIPENAVTGVAAEKLLERAETEIERAKEAYDEGKIGRAFGQVAAATKHLEIVKRLIERAQEWEETAAPQLAQWREAWENMKQELAKEGTWQNVLENYQQHAEQLREMWRERWQEIEGKAPPVPK